MVVKEQVLQRLNEIKESLDYLRGKGMADFDNREKFLLSRYYLQIMLEAVFTIGNQIIADRELRKPTSYKDILMILAENDLLSRPLTEALGPFAEMRSLLVHAYWKISKEELTKVIENQLSWFERFVREISEYLRRCT